MQPFQKTITWILAASLWATPIDARNQAHTQSAAWMMFHHPLTQSSTDQTVTPANTFFHVEGRHLVADSTGEKVAFRGVNLNGLEFGSLFNSAPGDPLDPYPGAVGTDYFTPRAADIAEVKAAGANLVRVPFEWARLTPGWQAGAALPTVLNSQYLSLLEQVVQLAAQQQLYVVLDMHDFLKYWSGRGTQQCVDDADPAHPYQRLLERTWRLLAEHFRENRAVVGFDLMNEPERLTPNSCGSNNWSVIAQSLVNAIREVDTKHLIFIEGGDFSLASHWPLINGKAAFVNDTVVPARLVYSPHVFFDFDNDSLYLDAREQQGPVQGWEYYVRDRLLPVLDWADENNVALYVGEMGVPCTAGWGRVWESVWRDFVAPLGLSVTIWHYIDPARCQQNACPLNVAACAAQHQLNLLRRFPGGVYQNHERDDPVITLQDSRLYDEQLVAPWQDGSFHDFGRNFCDPSAPTAQPQNCAIKIHFQRADPPHNFAGFKLLHLYGVNTRRWAVLRFRILLTGTQQQNFKLWSTRPTRTGDDVVYPPDTQQPDLMKYLPLSSRQSGRWQTVDVPLRELVNPVEPIINGIGFQNMGEPQEPFYLDDVQLIPCAGVTGCEADVRPRNQPDAQISVADWVQVGRLAAGLDAVLMGGGEFQRADCAPRRTAGDGRIGLADWVQAGRYAAQLDLPLAAGGPNVSLAVNTGFAEFANTEVAITNERILRLVRRPAAQKQGPDDVYDLFLEALGDENALSFSLKCDIAATSLFRIVAGRDAAAASLHINERRAEQGRVGVMVALPAGRNWGKGARQIAVVSLPASSGVRLVDFAQEPLAGEIVSVLALPLPVQFRSESGSVRGLK